MRAIICDSCEQPIEDMDNRAQVLIYTSEPIADPQLDLCGSCAADVIKSSKVKRGQEKAMERIRAKTYTPEIPALEIDGVDPESGMYIDMPVESVPEAGNN